MKHGKIRDLLCNSCNSLIGYAKENIDILQKSIDYIKNHKVLPMEKSNIVLLNKREVI
jgi:hypothetical protein